MVDKYTKGILTLIALLLAFEVVHDHFPEAVAENGLKKGLDKVSQRRIDPIPVVNCRLVRKKPLEWACGEGYKK